MSCSIQPNKIPEESIYKELPVRNALGEDFGETQLVDLNCSVIKLVW